MDRRLILYYTFMPIYVLLPMVFTSVHQQNYTFHTDNNGFRGIMSL